MSLKELMLKWGLLDPDEPEDKEDPEEQVRQLIEQAEDQPPLPKMPYDEWAKTKGIAPEAAPRDEQPALMAACKVLWLFIDYGLAENAVFDSFASAEEIDKALAIVIKDLGVWKRAHEISDDEASLWPEKQLPELLRAYSRQPVPRPVDDQMRRIIDFLNVPGEPPPSPWGADELPLYCAALAMRSIFKDRLTEWPDFVELGHLVEPSENRADEKAQSATLPMDYAMAILSLRHRVPLDVQRSWMGQLLSAFRSSGGTLTPARMAAIAKTLPMDEAVTFRAEMFGYCERARVAASLAKAARKAAAGGQSEL